MCAGPRFPILHQALIFAVAGSMDPGEHTMVDGTSLRRIRAAVPALPDELVQWDILLRLPAKELLRCRAVCRTWCRLASDAAFLLAHHRRQPSLPLVFFRTTDHPYTNDASVDALDVRRTPAVRRPVLGFDDYNKSRRKFTLHASCDGLLLLSLSNHRFYLCNPATRQWCVLPGLTGGNVTALYPHRPSGKYRVLSWKHPNNDRYSVDYYVLALGSCSSQSQGPKARCIGLPVASPSMKKKNSPDRWLIHACEHPPVLLRDCLHWYAGDVLDSKIVVFDTVAESFRWMARTLGIGRVDCFTRSAQVLVLQDYEAEVWSSKCTTELPEEYVLHGKVLGGRRGGLVCLVPNSQVDLLSENGDVLVNNRCFYNSKGELLEKLPWQSVRPRILGLYHKESLVRHVFFPRNKNGSRVRLPRFFRGL
ncbi:hypothetical protein VPH35_057075 [Triticum aestivum]